MLSFVATLYFIYILYIIFTKPKTEIQLNNIIYKFGSWEIWYYEKKEEIKKNKKEISISHEERAHFIARTFCKSMFSETSNSKKNKFNR
jgi:hypothetical protein